tara:strand:+ start:723 stop:905 length:183 start_codon:yes stop_codon:yes gene_type:complete
MVLKKHQLTRIYLISPPPKYLKLLKITFFKAEKNIVVHLKIINTTEGWKIYNDIIIDESR